MRFLLKISSLEVRRQPSSKPREKCHVHVLRKIRGGERSYFWFAPPLSPRTGPFQTISRPLCPKGWTCPGGCPGDGERSMKNWTMHKFYQELQQEGGKDYRRSAHLAIWAGLNRYLTSDKVAKTFWIITDPVFKTANKSLNAKLKRIKVKHHSSI